jgi:hypothetical protein
MDAVPCRYPRPAVAMTEEIDIWRAAHLLVKRHGDEAAIVAAQRADELLERGDVEGQFVWKRISKALNATEYEITLSYFVDVFYDPKRTVSEKNDTG